MMVIFEILMIVLLPNFVFYCFHTNSLSLGMFISSLIIFLLNFNTFSIKRGIFLFIIFIFSIIYIISLISFLEFDYIKPIASSILFIIILISSYSLAQKLVRLPIVYIERILKFLLIIFLILGWFSILIKLSPCGKGKFSEAVFPFTEPSHFALAVSTFLIPYSLIGKTKKITFFLVNFFILSFLFPSLTLLVSSFLSLIILIRKNLNAVSFIFIFLFLLLVFFLMVGNIDYFKFKLSFIFNPQNINSLSALVYLRGWELAYLNALNNFGFGLGFQMLGHLETKTGLFSEMLESLNSSNLNLQDGSFTASKLIAEFGIIGIIISFLYLLWSIYFIFFFKRDNLKILFIKGLILSFFINMYIRGTGYFNPQTYFLFVAIYLYFLYKNSIKRRKKYYV